MRKIIIIFFIFVFVISNVFATINLYSGESYSFESEEFEYYSVVGNSSNMEGMNISWNGNTTISFVQNFAPDNFTLIFFNSEKEVINHYSSGGGGGSRTIYKDRNITTYVDKIIYKEDDTEIQKLNDDKKILEEKIRRMKVVDNVLRILLGIFLLVSVLIVSHIMKKKNIKTIKTLNSHGKRRREL